MSVFSKHTPKVSSSVRSLSRSAFAHLGKVATFFILLSHHLRRTAISSDAHVYNRQQGPKFSTSFFLNTKKVPLLFSLPLFLAIMWVSFYFALNAQAAAGDGRMIAFWDDSSSYIPTGWTCVSCNPGDPFYEKFIMGGATYGTVGGGTTTAHTAAWVSSTNSSGAVAVRTRADSTYGLDVHAHNSLGSQTVTASDTRPPHRGLKVIRYNTAGDPAQLPTGIILLFDATVPTGWTAYSAQNTYFVQASSTVGVAGGAETHTHPVSMTTGSPSVTNTSRDSGATAAGTGVHTHTGNGTSAAGSNLPPYIDMIMGKLNATSTLSGEPIALWDDTPTNSWSIISNTGGVLNNSFFRASTTYSTTAYGASTHTHSNLAIVSGAPSATLATEAGTDYSLSTAAHTHSITVSLSSTNHTPPYVTVIMAKRFPQFVAQTAYIFLNDNGTTTDTYTRSHSAATSTAISSVKKGEKLIARIQIDNTGEASSTAQYRLQWENNTDAANTWTDIGTTTQIRWALSDKAAMPGRSGGVPLTSRQVGTCTTTTTFVSGFFVAGTATSSMLTLGPTKCTELAYAIETSGATINKTYRLRLVTGSTTTALQNYTEYPTFSIEATQSLRYSKEARGGHASSTLLLAGTSTAIAIGADGLPVMAYSANAMLNFGRCIDAACSTLASTILDNQGGTSTSIAIGADGFPVISYMRNGMMNIAKCNNIACTALSAATSTLDNGGASSTSITIGADGFAAISYISGNSLRIAKCNNTACTATLAATSTLDNSAATSTSIAIGDDGFPVISYVRNDRLQFVKCANAACTSAATSTLDNTASGTSTAIAVGSDGFPVIAYIKSSMLNIAKCSNISCSSAATSTVDNVAGTSTSLAIGQDGFPVLTYYALQSLRFAKCNNVACSSIATSTLDNSAAASSTSMAIGVDGFPVISYISFGNLKLVKCNDMTCSTAVSSTANLTATTTDLSRFLDDDGYTNVATSDNFYDQLSAGTSTRLAYLFTKKHANNTDPITPTWEGQVSRATTTYLKIFNHAGGTWETLASNTGPTPNTDFTLTGTQSSNLANYYDGSNVAYFRVETGTTTASTTLKTDQMTITFPSGPTLSISYYRWREDNGTEIAATYTAAENTALATSSNIYRGDRKRLRFSVANTGFGSASGITYLLEHASSSCTSWYAVPSYNTQTTQEWVIDQSQWIPDGAVTTASLSVPPGKSFVAGQARLNLNQTSSHALTTAQYTEFEFSFRSTSYVVTDLPYCFRLTNAGSITNFSYVVEPRLVVSPGRRSEYGGGGREESGVGAAHVGGGDRGGSGSEGSGSGAGRVGGVDGGGGGDSG